MTALRPALGPGLLVGAVALAVWLPSGVAPDEVALFLGYEAAFVWGPGIALYALLAGRDADRLRLLAVGGMLGLALEVVAHVASVAAGATALMLVLPALGAGCALAVRARGGLAAGPAPPAAWKWAVAAVAALAVAWVGLAYVPGNPLPGPHSDVNWNFDLVYDLALAGEAKHHFPLEEPLTAGTPLSYHTFPYYDMAAISNVTGIDLPVVLLRLHLVPLLVLIALQLAWAGRALTGRAWAGPVAAALFLFLGELDLDPEEDLRFGGWLSSLLWGPNNHGFVLGLCFFIPALVLLAERLTLAGTGAEPRARRPRAELAVLAIALIGCAGAKGVAILPLLGAGLGLWLLVRLVVERRLDRGLLAALAGVAALLAVTLPLQYPSPDRGSELRLLSLPQPGMLDARALSDALPLGAVVDPGLLLLGLVGCLPAIAAGIAFTLSGTGALSERRAAAGSWRALALCLLAAGIVPLLIVHYPKGSHVWPLFYGAAAASPLAAEGLIRLWAALRERVAVRAIALAAGGLAALLAAIPVASEIAGVRLLESHWSAVSYLALAVCAALAVAVLVNRTRLVPLAAVGLAALLVAAALDLPIDAAATADHDNGREPNGLTGDLYAGLVWVREHSDPDDVLAVNNRWLRPGRSHDGYAYYSGIAERRVLLGGPDLIADRSEVPQRSRLNDAIFDRGSRAAAAEARSRYGVRWLLVDKFNGPFSADVRLPGRLAYSNRDLDVYELR